MSVVSLDRKCRAAALPKQQPKPIFEELYAYLEESELESEVVVLSVIDLTAFLVLR